MLSSNERAVCANTASNDHSRLCILIVRGPYIWFLARAQLNDNEPLNIRGLTPRDGTTLHLKVDKLCQTKE